MSDSAILKNGMTLAAIAAICTAMVALTYRLTADRIVANEQALLERSLEPVLSGLLFDSGVTESKIIIPPPHALPGSEAAIIYRVFAEGEPVAALFIVSARDGYAGAIKVLVGVDMRGIVTGVDILEHRETPGLGDRVESSKSDWVRQFAGRSLSDPEQSAWSIKRDGGDFDQLTGASVTPRAIVKAIYETLVYFSANQKNLFDATAEQEEP